MAQGTEGGTSEGLTVHSAAAAFEALLSQEDQETIEGETTPPKKEEEELELSEDEEGEPPAKPADGTSEIPEEDEEEEPLEEEEPVETPPAPRTHKVTVNGEELEVEEAELLKGYSRTADYTKKTQALAEEKRGFESEMAEVRAERARYATVLTQFEQKMQQELVEPDWAKLRSELSPADYAATWAEFTQHREELQKVNAAAEKARQKVTEDQQRQMLTTLREENQKLVESVPEWKDPEKLAAGRKELVEYASSIGWSEEVIDQVVDHRAIVMLRKAMLYDKAVAKAKAAKKSVTPVSRPAIVSPAPAAPAAPKTPAGVKPGAAPASRAPRRGPNPHMQRLKASGRVEDAAAAILDSKLI